MLSCRDTARLLSESLDAPLPLARRIGLRFHLMMCRLCRRYAKQTRGLDQLVRDYGKQTADEAPPTLGALSPKARKRMRNALRDQH